MKFTMSKDGQRRATIRVEHRVGFEDLVRLMSHYAVHEIIDEERPERLSQAFILGKAKDLLRFHGSDRPSYWADDIDDAEAEEIREWAEGIVRQAFGHQLGLGVGA